MVRLVIATFLLLIVAGLNLLLGSAEISFVDLFQSDILWQLRMPRTLTALVAGAALAICGQVMQVIFRNPLATPYTLGVASSAGLGAIIAMSFGLSWSFVSLSSLGFALIGVLFLGIIYFRTRVHPNSLLLLGVAINLFCSGAISIVQVSAAKFELASYLTWIMGTVSVVGFEIFIRIALALIVLTVFIAFNLRNLSILAIEGDMANTRGFDPRRLSILLLGLITVVVAVLVSSLGPIGFIGLVVPHLVSRIFNSDAKTQLAANLVVGGLVLIAADLLNRTFFAQMGLPVGVMTTLFGAPALMVILLRKN